MTVGRAKSLVLVAWSSFFLWLLFSGEVYRYIGPRTYWVVIFGAVCLGSVALGNVALMMRDESERPTPRQLIGVFGVLIPIVLVVVIPKPSLGSLAASRKLSGGVVSAAVAPPVGEPTDEVGFAEIGYASESAEYAAAIGLSDGDSVELTGFVSDVSTGVPEDAFPLTRFSIFCCAADAIPYTVPVRPTSDAAEAYPRDTWLDVQGELYLDGETWVLEADRIEEVSEPANPYI